ncbi:hypothetical protein TrCOL_g416 [Triparma columacea]|uniref:Serine/threonine-protein phosphatase 2A 55 kDa regulatory subunit B n=1 Tax=Triparma columacea TaxID=722753 RepID=A0A9W7LC79_9STRA|nr:hypothetical protein TrCOL_g416 [Triparma columacea]
MDGSQPGLYLSQCFGEIGGYEEGNDADTLSACQFDGTGQYLATGDKGGRIVIFKKAEEAIYEPYAEFQSHESDFDYLKSLEIEERINQIQFLPPTNNAVFLLSTNDKTVKLWKVGERRVGLSGEKSEGSLFPPKAQDSRTIVATPRRTYANAHNYHINSISMNSDGETFVSADDLRINLWSHEIEEECFNIVDIKPPSMEDLTEVITSCQFHPSHCHMMIHSSSKGSIKLGDLRARALVDTQSKVLQQSVEVGSDKSFFSEIIASISDARFSPDGRYIVSRDYMTLKLWDVNMESSPVLTIPLQQHLTSKFVQLYENDCIFDKFECCVSGDGMFVGSGSYDGVFKVFNASTGKMESEVRMGTEHMERSQTATDFNFSEKVLHLSWSPTTDTLAVCGSNRLYIYNGIRDGKGGTFLPMQEERWDGDEDKEEDTSTVAEHVNNIKL